MVSPPSTRELRMRFLDRLRHIFSSADNRTRLAQAAYKRYNDKNKRVTKRFNNGDMVFIDRPKHEPKISKERDEQIAKSKLLPKSTGPFKVISSYPDVTVVEQDGVKLPVSVDRCSRAPDTNSTPKNPNLESDMTNPAFPLPRPLVTEHTKVFVNEPAHQTSETAAAHFSLHVRRADLDPTIPCPDPIVPPDKTTKAEESNTPTTSAYSTDALIDPEIPLPPPTPAPSKPTLLKTPEVYSTPLIVFRFISHEDTVKPIRYTCQLSNNVIFSYLLDTRISPRLLAAYCQSFATKSHVNPHMKRRGCPIKENGDAP